VSGARGVLAGAGRARRRWAACSLAAAMRSSARFPASHFHRHRHRPPAAERAQPSGAGPRRCRGPPPPGPARRRRRRPPTAERAQPGEGSVTAERGERHCFNRNCLTGRGGTEVGSEPGRCLTRTCLRDRRRDSEAHWQARAGPPPGLPDRLAGKSDSVTVSRTRPAEPATRRRPWPRRPPAPRALPRHRGSAPGLAVAAGEGLGQACPRSERTRRRRPPRKSSSRPLVLVGYNF
jgi:hypothetical protein